MNLQGFIKRSPDPNMTFSSFIEGESNRFARAMALAVGEKFETAYNPLYIYGGKGLGKSHLLAAIFHLARENGTDGLLGYLESRKDNSALLRDFPGALFIDDISFVGGAQELSLKEYVDAGGKLVLSGAASPEDTPDSVLSMLVMDRGKCADIQPPEEELRIAIVQARAEAEGIKLPYDAAQFIASHISGNIRTLIGGLKRVSAVSALSGQEINRFSAVQALKDYIWIEEKGKIG